MSNAEKQRLGRAGGLIRAYVGSENLEERAAAWLEEIEPYTRHPFHRQRLGNRPALLVMDMQRFFLDQASGMFLPAASAILPRVRSLLDAFRAHRLPVVLTRHRDRPGDTHGPMCRWWGRPMREDDPLNALYPGLDSGPREILTVKGQYSAFQGTRLEVLLKQLRITSTVICGVMTHLCCETTSRDAFMRGFDVIFTVDATATLNEVLHVSSLRGLAHGFVSPVLVRDVVGGLAS